ncbi:putative domain HDIG [Archaeoglobus sulfaticallidus PM70-1]|uniref:Putative domain HDIG n=1 Tax=Archaeoglobus sulfaticallidus PM70-1 TaxID=387631 RepID=N0BLX6_9EURY|nr:HDIG domain-containing metalloprotein [Archaeoglobus sulfaticallidus]AGK61260.1 putative domain HDIG [Archaeoglobus sulfaticallidus PM70-1]
MNREKALNLLKKHVKSENLIKHCIATSAIMKELAKELGEDEEKWEIIGILHDIDYEMVGEDMTQHGLKGAEILKSEGVDDEIVEVVRTHNHTLFGNYSKPVEIALQSADSVSGLIVACALVKKGKLSEVTPKTVKKKFKEKSFAAGCDRNRIREVEKLGIELPKLYEIGIRGLMNVREELGLE